MLSSCPARSTWTSTATIVHLKAGDVLVQRGTIHNWINKGIEPCVIAFTLVSAKSVNAGGKTLPAQG